MRVRWIFGLCACLLFGALGGACARTTSVGYQKKKILGLPVHVITVDLNDPEVKVTTALARGGLGKSERFGALINRVHPAAAITGTFFDTRSLMPIGDIVVAGQMLHQGMVGTGVAFTRDNQVDFVPLRDGRDANWAQYEAVLCAGPWLVKDGVRTVRPRDEGFRDRSLYALRQRAAIGVTAHNKLLLVTIPRGVYYTHVSKVMKALGAVNALGLDGGSSTALSLRGRIISKPSRRLTNVLLVYDKPWRYESAVARGRLAPQIRESEPAVLPLEMLTEPEGENSGGAPSDLAPTS